MSHAYAPASSMVGFECQWRSVSLQSLSISLSPLPLTSTPTNNAVPRLLPGELRLQELVQPGRLVGDEVAVAAQLCHPPLV